MMNRVRNAHAWAALLLLAAACGDSGGGGDDDKDAGKDAEVETDAEVEDDGGEKPDNEAGVDMDGGGETGGGDTDSGGGGSPGGGEDATVGSDSGMADDTGVTSDTGTPGGGGNDAGSDAGTDAGPSLPTGCAETAIVAGTGGSVTSTDSHFKLTLAGGQLSGDATVRVCLVAAASAPASLDGRIGDAYEVTTTGGATFTAATALFTGHSALPPVDATPTFDPPTVRTLATGGSTVATGTNAVLTMSKRALAADTVTRLSATIGGPGHVFVASLEAPGAYRVNMHSATKTAIVTGEIIDFGTTVAVTGSPAARTFEAEVDGCNLDPLNATPLGSGYAVISQPGAVRNHAGCTGNYVPVRRVGGATAGNIWGGSTGTAAALTGGTMLDMQDPDSTALGLYCQFPGAGQGAARLFFKTGSTVDLEITKDIEVTCTYSGDLIAVYDEVPITRGGSGDYVVGTTYTPRATAAIATPTTFTALAPDAVTYPEAAMLSGTGGPTSLPASAKYVTGTDLAPIDNPTNSVTFNYATDRYTAAITNANGFYQFQPRAELLVSGFNCFPPSSADLSLQLSGRNGSSSTVAITDSSIDLISIRVRVPGTGAATIVQRLIDATKVGRFEPVPFLTAAQQSAVTGTPSEYAVGFYRLAWDERRSIWDGGRIVPVACGTVLMFEAADVLP